MMLTLYTCLTKTAFRSMYKRHNSKLQAKISQLNTHTHKHVLHHLTGHDFNTQSGEEPQSADLCVRVFVCEHMNQIPHVCLKRQKGLAAAI